MKQILKKELLDKGKQNKTVKTLYIVAIGVASLFVVGKIFHVMAGTVRSYNNLKLAMNGK
ncbi:MAG: hypothetical protein CFE24_07245 [Flavobacterium sp. BFFFF2]|nr:MAG: hypothetical protein CFE24_07245 [Flavobacterium sp. BFFFF2]